MFSEIIDHHCHGIVSSDLDHSGFEALFSEAHDPGSPFFVSQFEKPLGLAIRRWCAPVLDLDPFAPAEDYVARRLELGGEEANRRLLQATGMDAMLVDTGHRADAILDCPGMEALSGIPAPEVVRIEAVFEAAMEADDPLAHFADDLVVRATDAVGLKSIVAYRATFDFDQTRPTRAEAEAALSAWQRAREAGEGPSRLEDPVLLRHALWVGLDLARERKFPIQFHVGFGDIDIAMHRCDPTIFTPFIIEAEKAGVPVTLLHCYPFEREAAWLAEVFSNVFFDVGAVLNYAGPSAVRVLGDAMELGPFSKQLYSSDAFGLSELHYLGRVQFEVALKAVLSRWIGEGTCTLADADRIAQMIAAGNARRIYPLEGVV